MERLNPYKHKIEIVVNPDSPYDSIIKIIEKGYTDKVVKETPCWTREETFKVISEILSEFWLNSPDI